MGRFGLREVLLLVSLFHESSLGRRELELTLMSLGMDMVATYIREKFHEGMALGSWESLDVDPTVRGQFYKA